VFKQLGIAATVLALAGSSLVSAQQPTSHGRGTWLSAQDVSALTDARVAALHAGLKLSPEQEKYWPAFEQSYREVAKLRAEQRAARAGERERLRNSGPGAQANGSANGTQARRDPIERLQRVADALSRRGAVLKQLADAADPLYQNLDEHQKRRFLLLSRPLRPYARFASERHGSDRD
jgi:zinc resistance-associated protein